MIPPGAPAADGAYVHYAADEHWATVCLAAHRHGASIVGENLGTVPPATDRAIRRHRALGMWVVQFELPDPCRPACDAARWGTARVSRHPRPRDVRDLVARSRADSAPGVARRAARVGTPRASGRHEPRPRRNRSRGAGGRRGARGDDGVARCEPGAVGPGSTRGSLAGARTTERSRDRGAERDVPRARRHTGWKSSTTSPRSKNTLAALDRARRMPDSAPRTPDSAQTDGSTHDPAHRRRSLPVQRGPPLPALRTAGRAPRRRRRRSTFAVWAPERERGLGGRRPQRLARRAPARSRPCGSGGVWSGTFAPWHPGDRYKFHIETAAGYRVDKADPFAFATEQSPPRTASVVADLAYEWHDDEWMRDARRERNGIDVADVDLRGAPRLVAARRTTAPLLPYREAGGRARPTMSRELGFTHVELLPIMEHPFFGSWGYQTHRLLRADRAATATPTDFMDARRPSAPARHRRDPRLGAVALPDRRARARATSTARTCTSTPTRARASIPTGTRCVFNYGRHEVRSFLLSQRVLLARPLPRRRAARRRRRVDALSRLLAPGGRVDPERVRRPREPRRDRRSCAS